VLSLSIGKLEVRCRVEHGTHLAVDGPAELVGGGTNPFDKFIRKTQREPDHAK
jgi:hypothetical protein